MCSAKWTSSRKKESNSSCKKGSQQTGIKTTLWKRGKKLCTTAAATVSISHIDDVEEIDDSDRIPLMELSVPGMRVYLRQNKQAATASQLFSISKLNIRIKGTTYVCSYSKFVPDSGKKRSKSVLLRNGQRGRGVARNSEL